jgi:hypothetical protein
MDWQTIAGLVARHAMTSLAGALVTLGLLQAGDRNNFISIASGILVGALGLAWSWWQKRGHASLQAELDRLARNYAALKQSQAAQAARTAALLALALGALLLFGADAFAQAKKPTGDPIKDLFPQPQQHQPVNPLDDLAKRIAALSLDDFKYAAALAHATGNTVTMACWDEWVKLISAQQSPLKDAQGNPLEEPPVHLATDIERLSEMIRQMQPNSELSVACAPMAQAAQKDVGVLIGAVLSGGAMGLFKLPFAIP